mgnify:CR=1 FL=1
MQTLTSRPVAARRPGLGRKLERLAVFLASPPWARVCRKTEYRLLQLAGPIRRKCTAVMCRPTLPCFFCPAWPEKIYDVQTSVRMGILKVAGLEEISHIFSKSAQARFFVDSMYISQRGNVAVAFPKGGTNVDPWCGKVGYATSSGLVQCRCTYSRSIQVSKEVLLLFAL